MAYEMGCQYKVCAIGNGALCLMGFLDGDLIGKTKAWSRLRSGFCFFGYGWAGLRTVGLSKSFNCVKEKL